MPSSFAPLRARREGLGFYLGPWAVEYLLKFSQLFGLTDILNLAEHVPLHGNCPVFRRAARPNKKGRNGPLSREVAAKDKKNKPSLQILSMGSIAPADNCGR